ncbi:MAG: hypothetical protein K6F26_03320 [Lachnospiraceae bacterium]|nr:hypothetical protein [Lachnospiraceae bacterium]
MKNRFGIEIIGVTTGIGSRPFFVKTRGRMDARRNQICDTEDGMVSPWIYQKKSLCEEYINSLYEGAAKRMETAHRDVIVSIRKLKEVELERPVQRLTLNEEQKNRNEMERVNKLENNQNLQKSLRLRLAEVLAETEQVDVEIEHGIERVKAVLRHQVLLYWQGVLRGMKAGRRMGVMPPEPKLMDRYSGQAFYVRKRDELLKAINGVIGEEETA